MTQPAQVDPSRAPTLPAPAMVSPPRVAPFTFGDPHIAFHDSDIDASLYDAIANGARDPAGLAEAALLTRELKFSRWYA